MDEDKDGGEVLIGGEGRGQVDIQALMTSTMVAIGVGVDDISPQEGLLGRFVTTDDDNLSIGIVQDEFDPVDAEEDREMFDESENDPWGLGGRG